MKLDISRLIDEGFQSCAEFAKQAESFKFLHEFQVKQTNKTEPDKLIYGDNLLASIILGTQEQKYQLIYIDPPYASNSSYSLKLRVGEANEKIKIPVYSDVWRNGLQSYLSMLLPRLYFMRNLLTDSGSIFVHVDTKASHYVKILMDEIFGAENFVNEIIYRKDAGQRVTSYFPRKHDVILFYAKDLNKLKFNMHAPLLRTDYNDTAVKMHFKPDKKHRLVRKYPSGKKFYKDLGKLIDDIWDDISTQQASSPIMSETTGFETQKPTALLERIISAVTDNEETYREKLALHEFLQHKRQSGSKFGQANSRKQDVILHNWTNEFFLDAKNFWLEKVKDELVPQADTIADFFAGSGTTGITAHQLKRDFVLCEIDRTAWAVTLKRLLSNQTQDLQCLRTHDCSEKHESEIKDVLDSQQVHFLKPSAQLDSLHQKRKNKPKIYYAPVNAKIIEKDKKTLLKIEIPQSAKRKISRSNPDSKSKQSPRYEFDFCIIQQGKSKKPLTASEAYPLNKVGKNEYEILTDETSNKLQNSTICIFDIFGNVFIADGETC